jgi:hypothetical protein
MKMNKKFFICAMLVLMLFLCVNAGSAAEPLNDALGADIGDEIAVSDVSNDALSASEGGDYATASDAVGASDGGQAISVENDDDSEADNATILKSTDIVGVSNADSSDAANEMPIADAADNIVTPENFFDFFDEDGFLLDSYDELIFNGEFDSLVDSIVIIDSITITGDGAVLNNIPVLIDSGDVILDNLVFTADESLGSLITIDGGNNILLANLDVSYSAGDEQAVAIDLKSCQDVSLVNSTIFFESHVVDDSLVSVGIQAVDTEYVLMDNNNITTRLPCVYVNNYDEDYYLMGSNNVNPVRLKDCHNLEFTNNYINSTTNDYSADFPTIQSIYIIGCTDSLIDHNDIYMIDEMTPAGLDNYLYGIDFGNNYNVTFSHNNFVMFTRGGQDQHGTAYAFQGVESTVNIIGNNITSISNGPNLGIYVASMFGEASVLYIADNFINVTGSASPSGSWALVSGIEIQNGDAQIYNNTIYTYNVNEYQDDSYMYGISYAQWMYGDRSFDIQNNTVYTEGKYTISIIDATSFNAEGNKLYAYELTGSDSIDTGTCQDVTIGDNYPPSGLNNIVVPENFYEFFDDSGILLDSVEFEELIFQGEFSYLTTYLIFNRPISVIGDDAVLNNMGIVISGSDVSLRNLTLIADDVEFSDYTGAVISVTNDNAVLDGLTIDYAPGEDYDAYAIYINANDFQLLNCDVNFTGSSLGDNYEYAMKIVSSNVGLIRGNTIRANLPILDVDYSKGDPGLDTDLVLNTGIKESQEIDIINNTFIANVIDSYGDYPTLDCVMLESCDGVNVINNTFYESDFLIEEGDSNYLNVLDMYYSDNVLVQGNRISVETTGGAANAGTAYPVQLTGPYENVVIDGNDLYAQCGGPALGVFSQNYYGDTEITVQNNNIDITGLPTTNAWGLVSGIELQDTVARVYNNTIKTRSVTGTFEEGYYLFGISYAQALNDNHCYDIQNNTVETEGKYTIYILTALDTIITGNSLVSSLLYGDDSIYIRDASGDTVIANNSGINGSGNIVTQDNFYDFFDDSGILLDSVAFDELIFQGNFSDLGAGYVILTKPIAVTGEGAVFNNMGVVVSSGNVTLSNLTFYADTALGDLVSVSESNVILNNLYIIYIVDDEAARAISIIDASDVYVNNADITFESHITDSGTDACAINIEESQNITVTGSEINSSLPGLYVNYGAATTMFMGLDQANPVRIMGSNGVYITRSTINSRTNAYEQEYATIQAMVVVNTNDCIIDSNEITLTDEFAQEGQDIYLYGISFAYDEGLVMSNNNFTVYTEGGMEAAGTAYAIQGIESKLSIIGNNISTFSNGPNLGIYVTSMAGEDSEIYIEGNTINVTGLAAVGNTWALVSGIEIQNGDSQIYNNTIYTYNVDEYDEDDYLSGISYIQYMYGGRSFDIQDNFVYTEGKYAIYLIDASNSIITGNTLYGHELAGNDAVYIASGSGNVVEDNLPSGELTNIVTQDNFYDFFDDAGVLKESIAFDELIFNGTFSDLVDVITFNRAIDVAGEDAVLDNIAIRITGDDVTLSGFTLNANNEFADNNGALIMQLVQVLKLSM